MSNQSTSGPISVSQAMDRVLAAEGEAQEQIEACRADAEQILAAARDEARRIEDTTKQRISRIHVALHARTAAQIRSMRRKAARVSVAIDYEPTRSAAVAEAAHCLARRLTARSHDDE